MQPFGPIASKPPRSRVRHFCGFGVGWLGAMDGWMCFLEVDVCIFLWCENMS